VTLPAIFFGHGNPMNALESNAWTVAWGAIGRALDPPEAVLCVSAHWYRPGVAVTAMASPRTIHDFGGFPQELYRVQYPAPGSLDLARRVVSLLAPVPVELDTRWGLDHGAWSVLKHVFPQADVPVVQLALDETMPGSAHLEIGRKLAALRDEGVLIVGSGNLVHNLHAYAWGRRPVQPFDWAVRFEEKARALMLAGDDESLASYEALGTDAMLSVPTPEHFLPLLHVLGARRPGDEVTFPVEGMDGGSISMLTVQVG
jgi:4,5-DOPA dioxygenase extradiol